MRTSLLAAALVAAAAVPASAAGPEPTPPPVCATFLAEAAAGASRGCATLGTTPLAGGTSYRTMTVEVLSGAVDALLQCGGTNPVTVRVSGFVPVSRQIAETSGSNCWVTITAVVDHTTAVVTNTYGFVFA